MKSISFKNFRRFADFPEFKFGDITILVGGNNAGKSTLVKALILIIDNMRELKSRRDSTLDMEVPMFSFDMAHIHQLNLGTLGRALRIGADEMDDNLEFTAVIDNFKITFDAGNGTYDLKSPNSPVHVEITDLKRNVNFKYEWLGKMSLQFNGITQSNKKDLFEIKNEISELQTILEAATDLDEVAKINERISKLRLVESSYSKDEIFNSSSREISAEYNNYTNFISSSDFSIPTNPLAKMVYQWVAYYQCLPTLIAGCKENDNANNKMRESLISAKQFLEDKVSVIREVAQELQKVINGFNDNDEIIYIQAHAISQRVLYNTDNRNDYMAQVLHKYSRENVKKDSEPDRFLRYWLKELGLGLDYRVTAIEGEGYTFEIETSEGVWQHLADLGMGSNQIATLLVELATLVKIKNNGQTPLIIVEEPEQNLHPRVQSKLADLFDWLNRNKGFRFLIETHSEYLIRRTQVLVAEMNIENEDELDKQNPFKVYYFPEGGVPYDMKYQTNGHFEEAFGEGFFDEAGKWTRQLIRTKRK